MKIRSVQMNNHRKVFVVRTYKDRYEYPYALLDTRPRDDDRIVNARIDPELGREAFAYRLASGAEDSVHIDRVLEYCQDPSYMRDLLLYKLTLAAKKLVDASPLGIREISRRLGTSPTQLYRVLDEENNRKSLDRVFELLSVLQCRIDIRSKANKMVRTRASHPARPVLELIVHV